MNIICAIALIIAAGLIGRLSSRKPKPPVVLEPKPETEHEYGLFVPPNCESVVFGSSISQFHIYHHDGYNYITIFKPKQVEIKFGMPYNRTCFTSTDIKGVVK